MQQMSKRNSLHIITEFIMSLLSLAFPVHAALPAAEALAGTAVSAARPILGMGAIAAVLVIFKPLLTGLLRAALLAVKPRRSLDERSLRSRGGGGRGGDRGARERE